MEIKGLDVSSFQGNIDWAQVAAAGYKYAVLRSITRSGTDSFFEKNYAAARAAGLKVGVYAFSYALTEAKAVQEAQRVADLLKGRPLELPIFLDLEWAEQRKLGKGQLTAIAQAFLKTITNNTGYQVGIYCNTDWYNNVLDTAALPYDYWIASYGTNDGAPHKRPAVPDMTAWQYTSQGKVPGISGRADLDTFYKEYGGGTPEPARPEKKSGWYQEDGGWRFYLGNTGQYVKNDWYKDGDNWYWFRGDGLMVHDTWYQYQGDWYYLTSSGAMARGLQAVDGKWFYLDDEGRMATEPVTLTPDEDGALQYPGLVT